MQNKIVIPAVDGWFLKSPNTVDDKLMNTKIASNFQLFVSPKLLIF